MTIDPKTTAEAIANGATIGDIAASSNQSWYAAAAEIDRMQVSRPSASGPSPADRLVARYLGLVPEGTHPSHDELVRQADGSIFGMPHNFSVQNIDLNAIFERFHGPEGYIDPYNGEQTHRKVFVVNASSSQAGRPRNFLVTNIETMSRQTIESRFCNWMRPIQETFEFPVDDWTFRLTISRPYDWLVGGTYAQTYMDQLFDRWVGQPITQHGPTSPEQEPVFRFTMPFEMAWWAWEQLTHAGLLKGLTELQVCHGPTFRTTVLRDDDVQNAIIGFAMKDRSSTPSLIVPSGPLPNNKFDPGKLFGR